MLTVDLDRNVTAKSLLLDLLRATEPNALPIKLLVSAGTIFGISENAIRVNVTRLVSKGQLEQDERGYYRAGSATSPLRSWLRNWRYGEKRVVPWQGDWISLNLSPEVKAKQLKDLEQACYRLGFREIWNRVWIRPNNLSRSHEELLQQLESLAQTRAIFLSVVSEINLPDCEIAPNGEFNSAAVWQTAALEACYSTLRDALEQSLQRGADTPVEEIFRESFMLGGEVIHLLAVDPLLPRELIDVDLREKIFVLMNEYDALCRPYWNEFFQKYKYNSVPRFLESHLNVR